MAEKGSLKSPNQMGAKGIPPGIKSKFRKGKGGDGLMSPNQFGDKGMPNMNPPGARAHDPRMD